MSTLEIWVAILGLMVITFLTRGFFLLMGARVELPEAVQRAIRYAPAAALVAIVVPEIFLLKTGSAAAFDWKNPHLWGGLAAISSFLLTRSMVLTIVLGMVGFTCARWYF
jgi:branched-subunit amino acid transport protein